MQIHLYFIEANDQRDTGSVVCYILQRKKKKEMGQYTQH